MTDPVNCWQRAVAAVEPELRVWRASHPDATLTEIEQALDARLNLARAALLAEAAHDVPPDEARCPQCGEALVGRGSRTRTLRTAGDAPLVLTRAYLSCPACGAGLSPPR